MIDQSKLINPFKRLKLLKADLRRSYDWYYITLHYQAYIIITAH